MWGRQIFRHGLFFQTHTYIYLEANNISLSVSLKINQIMVSGTKAPRVTRQMIARITMFLCSLWCVDLTTTKTTKGAAVILESQSHLQDSTCFFQRASQLHYQELAVESKALHSFLSHITTCREDWQRFLPVSALWFNKLFHSLFAF